MLATSMSGRYGGTPDSLKASCCSQGSSPMPQMLWSTPTSLRGVFRISHQLWVVRML